MPIYEIYHSHPLTSQQRQSLATTVTNLHCTTFTTPSFFVHLRFIAQDPTNNTYFTAGKPRSGSTNRIIGIVRTSAARSKADFDALATKLEEAWYDTVGGSILDEEKRLVMVTLTPMVAVREAGMTIPEAGKEGEWFREMMPFFKEMKGKGVKDFSELLEELEEREDLKRLLA